MSDTVIVYVTRTGNSRALANGLGDILKAPVHEVIDKANRKGVLGFIKGGADSSMKSSPPIQDPGIELKGVHTVVLVQPVWASNLCPPLRTWLRAHKEELKGVRLALLASHLGSPPEKFRANAEKEFGAFAAFAAIIESTGAEGKKAALKDFAAQL
jgi:hypothetical protein